MASACSTVLRQCARKGIPRPGGRACGRGLRKSPCTARIPMRIRVRAGDSRRCYQPRVDSRSFSSSWRTSRPFMASPSSCEASSTALGSSKCVAALTMARARCAGSLDLKMPEPTKTASAPSWRTRAASAGVAMPPAEKFGTGSLPSARDFADQFERRAKFLGDVSQLVIAQRGQAAHFAGDGAHVPHGFDDVARSGFALGANHGRAFGDAPQRFAQIARAADERHLEVVLPDVIFLVGGRENFALVDEIHFQSLEHLRFGEVADARLGHHRNADRVHDFADDARARPCGRRRLPCGYRPERAPAPSRRRRRPARRCAACSALVTSIMTPPLSISARPDFDSPLILALRFRCYSLCCRLRPSVLLVRCGGCLASLPFSAIRSLSLRRPNRCGSTTTKRP